MSELVPVAWAGLVLWGAWLRRPLRSRGSEVVGAGRTLSRGSRPVLARVGRALRRGFATLARRPFSESPETDRSVGFVAVLVLCALLVGPWLVPVAVVACVGWIATSRRRVRSLLRSAVVDALPDAVDLLWVAVSGGITVVQALRLVAAEIGGPLGDVLGHALGRLDRGDRLADALDVLHADSTFGDVLRPLALALTATERLGVPLLESVERLAHDARATRRRRAETQARRAPVLLLFPLICCTLPAFALLTVVPLFAGGLASLGLHGS